jgi:ATP-dependent DNA ligase
LRVTGDRFKPEVRSTPDVYIVFDMLADESSLLHRLFRERRLALGQFFRAAKPTSPPSFLSASTADLKTVEAWIRHIGQQLDGIVAKRVDAPYPGDDRSIVKIKNYRSADCVIGGFRDRSIASTHDEVLLGLYDRDGRLNCVDSVGITEEQRRGWETPATKRDAVLRASARRKVTLEN